MFKAQDVASDSAVFRSKLSLDVRLINTLISSLGVSRLREVSWKAASWTQRLDHRAERQGRLPKEKPYMFN